jgi:hypothetical protein
MRAALCLPMVVLAGLASAPPALADCAADVAILKARIARENDAVKSIAAKKQLGVAQQQLKGSESECRNAVTRAYRILNAEPQPIAAGQQARQPLVPAPGKPWNTIR